MVQGWSSGPALQCRGLIPGQGTTISWAKEQLNPTATAESALWSLRTAGGESDAAAEPAYCTRDSACRTRTGGSQINTVLRLFKKNTCEN